MLKRSADVALASLGLLLVSPILAVAALGVLLFVGGPVLFRQVRVGYRGEPFLLLKLRTMRDDSTGLRSDAERLTACGRFLRRTSIDELPQLWNVLTGEMSMVGPRPLLIDYLPLYTTEQARRHQVQPGITGLAQVRGRNALSWEERFRLDVRYVDEASLTLDLRILAETVVSVLSGQGVDSVSGEPMARFAGSAERPEAEGA